MAASPLANGLPNTPALIGNSSSALIFIAAEEAGFPLKGAPFALGPQPPFNADITEFHPEILQLLKQGAVFSIVNTGARDLLTLIQHPQPFDFILPDRPDLPLDPNAQLISFYAMRDAFSRHLNKDFSILALAKSCAAGKVIHIISQPPLESEEIILTYAPWQLKESDRISSPWLRLKAYLLCTSLLIEFCKENGIEIIYPPAVAIDDKGFLKTDYYSNATHANVAYGRLVLEKMKEWV